MYRKSYEHLETNLWYHRLPEPDIALRQYYYVVVDRIKADIMHYLWVSLRIGGLRTGPENRVPEVIRTFGTTVYLSLRSPFDSFTM